MPTSETVGLETWISFKEADNYRKEGGVAPFDWMSE